VHIVRQLLGAGADANATCAAGDTPLSLAITSGAGATTAVVRQLLGAGADASAVSATSGDTLLHRAARRDAWGACHLLLLLGGADPCARNGAGQIPLHVCPPHSEALRQLLDWRAHEVLSAKDAARDTVAHHAARAGDARVLRALLERDDERGTLLRALNAAGDSALALTARRLAAAADAAEAAAAAAAEASGGGSPGRRRRRRELCGADCFDGADARACAQLSNPLLEELHAERDASGDMDVVSSTGVMLRAHARVLAARSKPLARMVADSTRLEASEGDEPETADDLLRFLYCGVVAEDVSRERVEALLRCADFYALPQLVGVCEQRLAAQLTPANALDALRYACVPRRDPRAARERPLARLKAAALRLAAACALDGAARDADWRDQLAELLAADAPLAAQLHLAILDAEAAAAAAATAAAAAATAATAAAAANAGF
jgi:hypothetical protein